MPHGSKNTLRHDNAGASDLLKQQLAEMPQALPADGSSTSPRPISRGKR